MASEENADKNKRKTLSLKVKLPNLEIVRELEVELPSCFRVTSEGRYGKILDLMSLKVYPKALTALAHFYDPPLRNFLFQDFQLTPTLEEFENIMGITSKGKKMYKNIGEIVLIADLPIGLQIKVPDMVANLKKKGEFSGYWRLYLEKEAQDLAKIKKWDAYGDVLALLVFGLVLFPIYEDFINSTAISIFWVVFKRKENPVPTLLADVLYSLHERHMKKGVALQFFFPLLYLWLISRIFKTGVWVKDMTGEEWTQTLVSLRGESIVWYAKKLNVSSIIFKCGSFPKVPLIGSKWCINYNRPWPLGNSVTLLRENPMMKC